MDIISSGIIVQITSDIQSSLIYQILIKTSYVIEIAIQVYPLGFVCLTCIGVNAKCNVHG